MGATLEALANLESIDGHVALPGGSVYVRRWSVSNPSGDPIVLLHDSLGSVDQWRTFPAELAVRTNRDVVAYDRLGFGRSSPRVGLPSTDFVLEEARQVFPALTRALGIERFIPFGHSVGGGMALTIAATSGSRCVAVISESAQAFVEALTVSGIRSACADFTNPELFARLERWHGDKARWVLDAWAKVWLSPEFASWSLDSCLKEITCPVLVMHGDRDQYGSLEFPRRIAQMVRAPVEQAILSSGHVPHREQQETVLQLVDTFLGQGI